MPSFLGEEIVPVAMAHVGERYVLGARAPVLNPSWKGPWDCAEFTTWCSYQSYGILFGVRPRDTRIGDAYTGYWAEDAQAPALRITVEAALATPGAFLLRQPRRTRIGHIAISLGSGRLVEAAGARLGVVARANTPERRWDTGVVLPGVAYTAGPAQSYVPPTDVLQVTSPYLRGPAVLAVQQALAERGYDPGPLDGIYGETTEVAVIALQSARGLIVDGEVGPQTAAELGLSWPIVPGTSTRAAPQAAAAPASAAAIGGALRFTFRKAGSQHFAKEDADPDEVLVGRDTTYTQSGRTFRGLAHRTGTDLTTIKAYGTYSRLEKEGEHGLWAHFLWPSIMGESGGLYARLNSYDAGFLTFGVYQLAAHTAGENLAELFRALLQLDGADAYFPDLLLVGGKVHRRPSGGSAPQPLEVKVQSQGRETSALALYLNPDLDRVDEEERLAGARLVHWTRRSTAARSAQVRVSLAVAKRKLLKAHANLDLTDRPLDQCIWVSDILHQGRAKYPRIKAALSASDPLDELSKIGSFPERLATVTRCVTRLTEEGVITGRRYEDLWLSS
jgi:peptidoglycan hydrolase-like protein with peptidoglycan-binding domain